MLALYLKEVMVMLFYSMLVRANAETFPNSINLIPAALIMALGPIFSKVMYDRYRGAFRFLGLLPVIAAFFVSPVTVPNIILMSVPAIYMVILIIKENKELEYYTYVELFTFLIIGGLLFLVIFVAMTWLFNQNPSTLIRRNFDDAIAGCKYFVAFFVCGVMVARNFRVKAKFSTASVKNLAFLTGTVSIAALVLLGFEKISGIVIKGLRVIIALVLMPVGFVSDGWTVFGHKVGEIIETSSGNPLIRGNIIEYFMEESSGVEVVPLVFTKVRVGFPFDKVYFAVTIIAFIVASVIATRILTAHKQKDNRDEFVNSRLDGVKVIKIRRLLTNRERIRSVYRRFLSVMKARGVMITATMTSEEILSLLTRLTNYDSAVALRNIYIKARYNESGDIDASEIKLAREALKKLSI